MVPNQKPLKIFSRYELAANHWTRFKRYDHRKFARALSPKVNSGDLLDALTLLYAETGLKCFGEAGEFLIRTNLLDVAAWHNSVLTPNIDSITGQHEEAARNMVRHFIDSGMSRRLAMANTAANLRWAGNSFDAAVKSIDRLCQDTSAKIIRTKLAGKCPKT